MLSLSPAGRHCLFSVSLSIISHLNHYKNLDLRDGYYKTILVLQGALFEFISLEFSISAKDKAPM